MRFTLLVVLALCITINFAKQIRGGYNSINRASPPKEIYDYLTRVVSYSTRHCNINENVHLNRALKIETQITTVVNYKFTFLASDKSQVVVGAYSKGYDENAYDLGLSMNYCQIYDKDGKLQSTIGKVL